MEVAARCHAADQACSVIAASIDCCSAIIHKRHGLALPNILYFLQVTRHNFEEVLPAVREALAACHFFALDLEMTGLHVRESRFSFHDDIQDQYEQVRR